MPLSRYFCKMKNQLIRVFSGSAHRRLTCDICRHLGIDIGSAKIEQFPNGETFVQIQENIRGADVFIVQPTCADADHNLMELMIMMDAAKRASARRITAVIPFYGYARQDRKDRPRVPISAKLVANLLVAAGANRILAIDLHAQQIVGFFDVPVDHLFAAPIFFDYLKKENFSDLPMAVFSPDLGGMKRAIAYADWLRCPVGAVAKRRKSSNEVEVLDVIGDAKDYHVLLVDDMSDTGNTLMQASKILKDVGAKRITAIITHAITRGDVLEKLSQSSLDEIITTDTIPVESQQIGKFKMTVLSVAKLLAEAISRIHNNCSITELFEVKGF